MPRLPQPLLLATLLWLCVGAFIGAQAQPGPADLALLPRATGCIGSVPRFSQVGRNFYPPSGTITMPNDTGWCWVQIGFPSQAGRTEQEVPPMTVSQVPRHGELITGNVDMRVRLAYRPQAGFSGHDSFMVTAVTPSGSYDIPVTVTVTP